MTQPLRIAVPIDLDWPIRRHLDIYQGIRSYAEEAEAWEIINDEFPAAWIARRGKRPGYDGVVGRVSPEVLAACQKHNVPVVNVWANSPAMPQMPTVTGDFVVSGRMAAEHLLARGMRRLASVGYRDRGPLGTRAFFEGVKAVAAEHRVPWSGHLVSYGFNHNAKAYRKYVADTERWFTQWQTPIGIASAQDNHARYITLIAQRRGLSVPDQIAIVGAGNDAPICEVASPSLTSIDCGYHRIGYNAAQLLDQFLKGEANATDITEPRLLAPAELVARASTDSYIVDDETVGRAMRYMAEQCGKHIDVTDVVAHVGCSRRTLERRFRETLGHTINDQLIKLRIQIVKRLLIRTRASIKSIADEAGFGTPEHMRYTFKKHENVSPGHYRRDHRR